MQNQFWVLRVFGVILRWLAWVVLIVGDIGAVLGIAYSLAPEVVSGGAIPRDATMASLPVPLTVVGLVGGIALFFLTLFSFAFIHAMGDLVHLLMSLEENTRIVAEHLTGEAIPEPAKEIPAGTEERRSALMEKPIVT